MPAAAGNDTHRRRGRCQSGGPDLAGGGPVSRRTLVIAGVVLTLLAMIPFVVWPLYKWLTVRPVSAALYNRTKALVDKNPQYKPDWDAALEDGVLTWPEANAILEKAGEKAEPEG